MKNLPGLSVLVVLCVLPAMLVAVAQVRDVASPTRGLPGDVARFDDPPVDDDDENDDEGDDCPPYPAPVPRTGQTGSYASGDDGMYQAGVSIDPRFTDNGDGTVTDNLTGLIWLQEANCFSGMQWEDALSAASGLSDGFCGLTDGSVAGDWRLPNVKELQSLIDYGHYDPALLSGHPFSGVQSYYRCWSSTTSAKLPYMAWIVGLDGGLVAGCVKDGENYVCPVRGPQ